MYLKIIYTPHKIAKECYLKEALSWVAFQEYPLEIKVLDNAISRLNGNFIKDLVSNNYVITTYLDYMSKEDIKRLNLLPDPNDYLDTNFELFFHNFSLHLEALNKRIEPCKLDLFLLLKEGKIKAKGFKTGVLKKNMPSYSYRVSLNFDFVKKDYPNMKFVNIPKSAWSIDGIDWESFTLKSLLGFYEYVTIDVENLLDFFPEPRSEMVSVKKVGHVFIKDINSDKNKVRGPIYDWRAFFLEMMNKVKVENYDIQNDLIVDMEAWCKKTWGKAPGLTLLKEKVAPFFKMFKEQKSPLK